MLILKLMGPEDLADDHPAKTFRLVQIKDDTHVEFIPSVAYEGVNFIARTINSQGDVGELPLDGNAYVMSESGKTIAYHTH